MRYNLSNKATIDRLLTEHNFSFKKSLGQNFLTNPTVCPQMAALAANENTGVLEIGPGIGVLTAALAEQAKKVVAIELDERLRPILATTLADYPNAKVIFGDALKLDLNALIQTEFLGCSRVTVCANLPYYITSPVIMALLEQRLPIESMTVMVQKEAAERLCAEIPGRAVGAITLAAEYYSTRQICFAVGRGSFTPAPKVDSAVLQLTLRPAPPVAAQNEQLLFRLIRAAFIHRRKTLVNSVSACGLAGKAELTAALQQLGLTPTARAEQLSLQNFADLANALNPKILA